MLSGQVRNCRKNANCVRVFFPAKSCFQQQVSERQLKIIQYDIFKFSVITQIIIDIAGIQFHVSSFSKVKDLNFA